MTSEETFEEIYTFFRDEEPATTDVVARGPRPTAAVRPGRRLPAEHRRRSAPSRSTRSTARPVHGWTSSPRHRSRCKATERGGRSAPGRPQLRVRDRPRGCHRPITCTSSRSCGATPGSACSPPSPAGSPTWSSAASNHSGMVILRYKEWWGDQGANSDILEINGVNILNAANARRASARSVPSSTTPGSDGVDESRGSDPDLLRLALHHRHRRVHSRRSDPPNATISIASTPRLGGGRVELINRPELGVVATPHLGAVQRLRPSD